MMAEARPWQLDDKPDVSNITLLCEKMFMRSQNYTKMENDSVPWCPVVFDRISCWPATRAGRTAVQPCPSFIVGWDARRPAFKQCLQDGTWFRHPLAPDNEWTNYTMCVDYEDFEFRQLVNNLYQIGYSLSLAAILISLVIFLSFRSLKCTRITIHIHLFCSFTLNNIMWLVWYRQVVVNSSITFTNPIWCQALHVVIQYFMVANYFWMFCEGLHLHLALVVVFVRDEVALRCFTVLGWGASALVVTVYAAVRGSTPEDRRQCWMDDSHSTWILTVPVLISLIASLVFLVNVVRVLLTKLHPCSARPAPVGMRKAVRATLILVPLFGLQLVLIPSRPDAGSPAEHVYQIVGAILVSMQGFCVACLFCFVNQDVVQVLGSLLRRLCPGCKSREEQVAGLESAGIVANGNTQQSRDLVI